MHRKWHEEMWTIAVVESLHQVGVTATATPLWWIMRHTMAHHGTPVRVCHSTIKIYQRIEVFALARFSI